MKRKEFEWSRKGKERNVYKTSRKMNEKGKKNLFLILCKNSFVPQIEKEGKYIVSGHIKIYREREGKGNEK